jgi:flagellar basal body P-ring protein FlgI
MKFFTVTLLTLSYFALYACANRTQKINQETRELIKLSELAHCYEVDKDAPNFKNDEIVFKLNKPSFKNASIIVNDINSLFSNDDEKKTLAKVINSKYFTIKITKVIADTNKTMSFIADINKISIPPYALDLNKNDIEKINNLRRNKIKFTGITRLDRIAFIDKSSQNSKNLIILKFHKKNIQNTTTTTNDINLLYSDYSGELLVPVAQTINSYRVKVNVPKKFNSNEEINTFISELLRIPLTDL